MNPLSLTLWAAASPSQLRKAQQLSQRESLWQRDKASGFAKASPFDGLPPRSGKILPAPGRNVTVGDKVGSRCRVSDRKGNKVARRKA